MRRRLILISQASKLTSGLRTFQKNLSHCVSSIVAEVQYNIKHKVMYTITLTRIGVICQRPTHEGESFFVTRK